MYSENNIETEKSNKKKGKEEYMTMSINRDEIKNIGMAKFDSDT